jgi:hypothetical protein
MFNILFNSQLKEGWHNAFRCPNLTFADVQLEDGLIQTWVVNRATVTLGLVFYKNRKDTRDLSKEKSVYWPRIMMYVLL